MPAFGMARFALIRTAPARADEQAILV